ncbi:MAG: hypothetical protein EOP00_23695 [Pedobacter sp.]|nr:MAG: hypothetical protein EOP00_23695 [Pedobacter sp.]
MELKKQSYLFNFYTAILLGLLLCCLSVKAQKIDTPANNDLNEAVLIKDLQQANIDSLVKIKLQQELKAAVGNTKKTAELEATLRKIERQDSLRKVAQLKEIESLKKTTKGFPVVLNVDTLFYIYTRTGSFDAKERAQAISDKIKRIYEDAFYNPDSLRINSLNDNHDIIYKKNLIVLTIANLDGLWFGKSNIALANDYLKTIKNSVAEERQSHSLINWLKRIGLSLLIVLVIVCFIKIINYLFRKTANYIIHHKALFENGLRVKKTQILTSTYLEGIFLKINSVIKIIVIVLIIYLSLPLLFSIFPETEGWTNTLLKWILSPLRTAGAAFVNYLPDLFTVIVVYFIFKYILKANFS